jgi:inward rectifier potassium channel
MWSAMAKDQQKSGQITIPSLAGHGRSQVRYVGGARDGWRDTYHHLLTMPIAAFFGVMAAIYLAINTLFGLTYLLVGGVAGARPGSFADAFFFSVETISTVGYGTMWPQSLPARLVMTAESFVGIFNLAVSTGLLFARISRPTARVMFSERAVVTKIEGEPTLVFRAANQRRNRIVEAEISVTLLHDWTTQEGGTIRRFETLATVRSRTPVFMLSWQIMHRIDELSPLLGETAESLTARHAEIIVVLKGIDETFAQTIHARGSYTPDRIAWGARLVDIFSRDDDGISRIDYTRFHDIV